MSNLTLRPYQAEGIDFLADRGRGALFDEPGLGKTMQALLAMRDLEPTGQILVVATGDATGVWQEEARLWLDEEVGIFSGLKPDISELNAGIVVTNYSRVKDVLPSRRWSGVIFDEAQALRNRKTATLFASVRREFDSGRLRGAPTFALSGSPIVKAAGDVWPLLHLIDPKAYRSYWRFVNQYSVVWQDPHGWHVEGVTNAKAMWAELAEYSLRRKVKEVQPDLPRKVRQRVPLTMTPKQAKVYRELERGWIAAIDDEPAGALLLAPTVLALETRLRQILVCPRLVGVDDNGAALTALTEIAANSPDPFVVFTPFPEVFDYLEEAFRRKTPQRPVYRVRGGMGSKLAQSVASFKREAQAGCSPILIASVHMAKSWSVSQVTSRCYMLGFDWNGTTMRQAEARLHRDGQLDTVFAGYLVHGDTLDERSIDVVVGKWRLADAILDKSRR